MSDHRPLALRARARSRDAGMTLPELLISITVLGLIVTVIVSAAVVTLRQQRNAEGRVNVAYAEQNVSMWIPADLASADAVDTSPEGSPCGGPICGGIDISNGSNVLLLSWSTENGSVTTVTNVSYNFFPTGTGTYALRRLECTSVGGGAFTCESIVVLHDLPGPPAGEPWIPGVANGASCTPEGAVPCTRPTWVIIVSQPLAADATNETQYATGAEIKDANRVVVTINGGGDSAGSGGGINQISITAGGTTRGSIPANSVQGAPSFVEARSRCGGPMTLLVDESNSIGSSITDVRTSVKAFITALAGTPVQLQVIGFHTYTHILGDSTGAWHRYFDMTNDTDVATLLAAADTLKGSWSGSPNGGTNWEEGLFRALQESDGSTSQIVPETLVFFTDGVPTFDRMVHRTAPGVLPAVPAPPGDPWPDSTGSSYSQVAFNRANYIAANWRSSVRLIGVGVGADITKNSTWMSDPGAGYKTVWERAYRRYQQVVPAYQSNVDFEKASAFGSTIDIEKASAFASTIDIEKANAFASTLDIDKAGNLTSTLDIEKAGAWASTLDIEKATAFSSNVDFEWKDTSNNWVNTTPTTYYTNQPGSPSRYRINGTRTTYTTTETEYVNYRNYYPSNWFVGSWADTTAATYYAQQPTTPSMFRIGTGSRTSYSVSEAQYRAGYPANPSKFTVSSFADTTPAIYYAEQPAWPSEFRIGSNSPARSAYTVSEAQYDTGRLIDSSKFFADGWADIDPATYYSSQPSAPTRYRITSSGGRAAYAVTEAQYDANQAANPSYWSITGWADTTAALYYGNQPSQPAKYRIGTDTRTAYTVTEANYDAGVGANPTKWSITGWADTTAALYYANQPTQPAKYRIGTDTRSSYTVTEAQYDAGVGANPTKWSITGWSDVTPPVYFAGQPTTPSKYRTNGLRSTWATVTQQQYDTYNVNSGETDGWRAQSSSATYVSKAVYNANNTTADMSDGWWDTGSNEYIASGSATDWEVWTASRSGIPSDQLRSSKVYNSPPYEAYDPAVTASTANSVILARMIAGNDYGTPAIFSGGAYTNADVADMYTLPNWSQMQTALQAVALGECGGTLTLQTKKNGSPVADPFRYQNSAVADSTGAPLQVEPTVVTTNQQFTTGTFDLDVSNGQFVTVDVLPQNYSELGAYTPGSWSCKAGTQPRTFTLIDIPGTNWKGVRVKVAANEAVACTLTVS